MYSKVKSAVVVGLKGSVIEIETQISRGMPYHVIVGLPSQVIRESKDRVKSALKESGIRFPDDRITQNMFPAHLKKEGAHLDLPIAMGIMCCIIEPKVDLQGIGFIGELSLEGRIRPVTGVLSLVEGFIEDGLRQIVMPRQNLPEVGGIKDIEVYAFDNLNDLVRAVEFGEMSPASIEEETVKRSVGHQIDFNEVIGQNHAIRAIEISAVGNHNLLMVGPAGCGKTMIAERLRTVLPPLTPEKQLESAKVYSLLGERSTENERPFLAPHHSITRAAMIGGTNALIPGIVTRAHNGVLFLDEILEFKNEVLQSLREPISNSSVLLTRNHQSVEYPCDFQLIATMNPCPCGNHMAKDLNCSCNDFEIKRYLNKLSGAILDRFDMLVLMDRVELKDVSEKNRFFDSKGISSRILKALEFKRQLESSGIEIEMNSETSSILMRYYNSGKLSMRGHSKLLEIAKSIALLEGTETLNRKCLSEAIAYQGFHRLKQNL
jgi:magnesium chelatase family protein